MIEVEGPIPPPNPGRRRIIRVSWTQPETFIAICERPRSVLTHWVNGRSQRCTMPNGGCDQCLSGIKIEWRIYVYCSQGAPHEPVFLDVSKSALKMLQTVFVDRDSLRGCMFQISKTKGGEKGRFVITPIERRIEPEALPPAESVDQLLDFLMNCKR